MSKEDSTSYANGAIKELSSKVSELLKDWHKLDSISRIQKLYRCKRKFDNALESLEFDLDCEEDESALKELMKKFEDNKAVENE